MKPVHCEVDLRPDGRRNILLTEAQWPPPTFALIPRYRDAYPSFVERTSPQTGSTTRLCEGTVQATGEFDNQQS